MFTIAEELLLLALDDDKGTVVFSASSSLNYGLAGAILAELTIQERITLEDEKVVVMNENGDGFQRTVLQQIKDSKKPRSVKHWVQSISFRMNKIKKEILNSLVKRNVLREEEQKILWVFSRHVYPNEQDKPEQQIRKRLHSCLYGNEEADERTVMLLSLIKACNLIGEVFPNEKSKDVQNRIDEVSESEAYGKAVKKSIEAMQTVVIAACASAAASSAASSGGGS
ncbi:GOLPH3/VPS74 family protein [Halobacillus hunanensis]|uniref:GOLPH3/VPS74 family protein n=1 Tax=Halobacillus hunanensis TaxID=578214 RepID=UPI001592979A|nr:GPP34 family phosphoprotein [Halobacillus hunanensis]